MAANLTKTEQLARPYLPPGGAEFNRIATSLGVDVSTLDHAALAAQIRDGAFENGTSNGNSVARPQDLANEVTAALVKIGVEDALRTAEGDDRVKDSLDNVRSNTPADHPKHFREIMRAQINMRIKDELAAHGSLGRDGIEGVVRAVIEDMSDAIDTAKAGMKDALDALAAHPPDAAALCSGLTDVVAALKHLMAGGDDLPTSLKIAFDDAFGRLDGAEKGRLAGLLASPENLATLVQTLPPASATPPRAWAKTRGRR